MSAYTDLQDKKKKEELTDLEIAVLYSQSLEAADELANLHKRLEEEKERNSVFSDCLHRGIQMWREANPGDGGYWISGDANIKWMLDEIAALRERVIKAEISEDELGVFFAWELGRLTEGQVTRVLGVDRLDARTRRQEVISNLRGEV